MRWLLMMVLGIGVLGCGSKVGLKGVPVEVAGKVTQNGQPQGDIVLVFQPLDDGHMKEFRVQKDGTFKGELITGNYAYFVTSPAGVVPAQVPKKLPGKYYQADLARTVTVEPGANLAITLD
ncbi:MAG: hypothetical protein IT425_11935 [Pirellulales bacterium]|nr:hypothetical protein [Pirellulales bacterium]